MAPIASFTLPSQQVELYQEVEIRIQAAVTTILESHQEYSNIKAVVHKFEVSVSHLRARLQGTSSQQEHPTTNCALYEDQELALCQYLNRLDNIGTSARLPMISECANTILQMSYTGLLAVLVVSNYLVQPFLTRHPEYLIRKQWTIDIDHKNTHQSDPIRAQFENYLKVCGENNIQRGD